MIKSEAEDASKNNVGVKLADFVIKHYKDPDTITSKQWEYTNGIVFAGMIEKFIKILNI